MPAIVPRTPRQNGDSAVYGSYETRAVGRTQSQKSLAVGSVSTRTLPHVTPQVYGSSSTDWCRVMTLSPTYLLSYMLLLLQQACSWVRLRLTIATHFTVNVLLLSFFISLQLYIYIYIYIHTHSTRSWQLTST